MQDLFSQLTPLYRCFLTKRLATSVIRFSALIKEKSGNLKVAVAFSEHREELAAYTVCRAARCH
jgi:hypothetical protein